MTAFRHGAPANWVGPLLVVSGGATFTLIVALQVGAKLSWHFTQPSAVQGGIEVLVLAAALAMALGHVRSAKGVALVLGIAAALYLRRHHVDAPFLLAALYAEGLVALGACWLRWSGVRRPTSTREYLSALFLGLCSLAIVIFGASLLGFGRPQQLLMVTLLLLASAAAWSRVPPMTWHLLQRLTGMPAVERAATGILIAWMLALFARTNNVTDFDSMWYGLRLPLVLVGERSMFDHLGLVSPVHYFPKLTEALILPLSGIDDFSFPMALTLMFFGAYGLIVADMLDAVGVKGALRVAGVGVMLTLPAIANVSIGAKGDVLAIMLLVFASRAAWSAVHDADARQLAWVFAAAILAPCAKLAATPFAAVVLVSAGIGWWFKSRRVVNGAPLSTGWPVGPALPLVILSTVLAVLVTTRTWLLAGVPTIGPEQLTAIWSWLGLEIRPPAGTLSWTAPQGWRDVPLLFLDWLFRPQMMEGIVATWTGNVWAFLPALGLAFLLKGARDSHGGNWVWWPAMLLGLWFAMVVKFMVRGGDGNYFAFPLTLAVVLGCGWVARLSRDAGWRSAVAVALLLMASWQAAYAFVTAGWGQPGTRVLDFDFARSPIDAPQRTRRELDDAGLTPIADYLRTRMPPPRVIGDTDEFSRFFLPARYEGIPTIWYSRPEYVKDVRKLADYLGAYDIRYLLFSRRALEKIDVAQEPMIAVSQLLGGSNWRHAIAAESDRIVLIDVRRLPWFVQGGRSTENPRR